MNCYFNKQMKNVFPIKKFLESILIKNLEC
jgi:hypothetical protein